MEDWIAFLFCSCARATEDGGILGLASDGGTGLFCNRGSFDDRASPCAGDPTDDARSVSDPSSPEERDREKFGTVRGCGFNGFTTLVAPRIGRALGGCSLSVPS